MGTYDSDNSDFGYKSVHMADNGHYNTESKRDRYFKFKEINLFVAFFNTRWNKANDHFSCMGDSKKVWNQRRKERKIAAHQPMSLTNFFGLMNFCIAFNVAKCNLGKVKIKPMRVAFCGVSG